MKSTAGEITNSPPGGEHSETKVYSGLGTITLEYASEIDLFGPPAVEATDRLVEGQPYGTIHDS